MTGVKMKLNEAGKVDATYEETTPGSRQQVKHAKLCPDLTVK